MNKLITIPLLLASVCSSSLLYSKNDGTYLDKYRIKEKPNKETRTQEEYLLEMKEDLDSIIEDLCNVIYQHTNGHAIWPYYRMVQPDLEIRGISLKENFLAFEKLLIEGEVNTAPMHRALIVTIARLSFNSGSAERKANKTDVLEMLKATQSFIGLLNEQIGEESLLISSECVDD